MLHTNWTIDSKKQQCQIDFDSDGHGQHSCDTSTGGESYLLIENISVSNEGLYTCAFAHEGGSDFAVYNVSVRGKTLISFTGHTVFRALF